MALYYLDDDRWQVVDGQPFGVAVKYACCRSASDQMLILPARGWAEEDLVPGSGGVDGMVTSVRLNCGLVFTSRESPRRAAACSEIETSRLIGWIVLALLDIAGLRLAGRIPAGRSGEPVCGSDDVALFGSDGASVSVQGPTTSLSGIRDRRGRQLADSP
jgi:hypothetical protein